MKIDVVKGNGQNVVLVKIDGEVQKIYNNQEVMSLVIALSKADDVSFKLDITEKLTLKDHRVNAGMSLEQLAQHCNCTRQTLSKVELGESIPRLDLAIKIADVLNIDVRDII